ncbi:trimeric intracellular cation channel family protein [Cochlodiniinecator piscidefendens]|uniref:trimeric intracellular cation channel family protein n=1 Tax=Cochlodiniinecator piscidefendens TaxID=2715756 RepID=UPI00140AC139|nr:trimeric intracellular cation channel family protein [Cochlodiniinecator piscidefendens]
MTALVLLDYASVLVFALTGALVASRAQLDIIGFAFIACLTALGGGTTRDVLLDRNPIFWIAEPTYILIAVLAALFIFLTAHKVESRLQVLLWLDALAMPIAAASGIGVALEMDQAPVTVALMGVTTGCFGGLLRDVVCNEVPLVLKQGELYVSAAFGGAIVALILTPIFGLTLWVLGASAAMIFVLRAGSLIFGWRLPVYKSRPPKA